ncbi:MAG: serine/threonine protein kinase, partial [Polyangiaceae bacterium]|nr:serine/threonine protein kinase [Polyangiaceae bacterium]
MRQSAAGFQSFETDIDRRVAREPRSAARERIGPWIIHRRLQRGGCAEVFHCHHESNGREAAIKLVPLDAPSAGRLCESVRYEARLLGRIRHPNVVGIIEQGELADGRPYLAMELARGHDLADRIDQHGAAPLAMAVEIGRQLLAALSALSAAGVVHRDVKPENIMLEETAEGLRVKLIDLGIAVSTLDPWSERADPTSGSFAGTPEYVSPEQAQGLPVDERADIYSLGAVLYELLVGVPPCVGSTPYETLVKAITTEPLPVRVMRPDCPPELEGAVLQALAKRPDARFRSAASMARALGICARLSA